MKTQHLQAGLAIVAMLAANHAFAAEASNRPCFGTNFASSRSSGAAPLAPSAPVPIDSRTKSPAIRSMTAQNHTNRRRSHRARSESRAASKSRG